MRWLCYARSATMMADEEGFHPRHGHLLGVNSLYEMYMRSYRTTQADWGILYCVKYLGVDVSKKSQTNPIIWGGVPLRVPFFFFDQ